MGANHVLSKLVIYFLLQMMHPYCIDTSVIFNVTGDRYRKSKLKYLSEHFLKETIQTSNKGHCPVEDSSASLRLAQLKLSESKYKCFFIFFKKSKIALNVTLYRNQNFQLDFFCERY